MRFASRMKVLNEGSHGCAVLRIDIESHVRKRIEKRVEAGQTYPRIPKRRVALEVEKCMARVEFLQFTPSKRAHSSGSVGGPVDGGVVNDDKLAVAAQMDVGFEDVCTPTVHRRRKGSHRVFRGKLRPAPMCEHERGASEERVTGAWGHVTIRRRRAFRRLLPESRDRS